MTDHSPDHAERAREVLAYKSGIASSWREGIITGQNSDWGHIRPSEAVRAMLAYADERVVAALRGRDAVVEQLPHHTSISLEAAMEAVRTGDTHRWSGAIYDHLRNYAALRAALDDTVRGEGA